MTCFAEAEIYVGHHILILDKTLMNEIMKIIKLCDNFFPNAGKYGPEKTPYLDTFHAVRNHRRILTLGKVYQKHFKIICLDKYKPKLIITYQNISATLEKIVAHKIAFCTCLVIKKEQ